MRRFLLTSAVHAAVATATVASAQSLYLPRAAADACPGCRVVACGSDAVRPVRDYAGTALLGLPRRGYVVAGIMDGPSFRALARQTTDRGRLADVAKPWGCCVGGCATSECCEKGLGSPVVTARWTDAWTGETVELGYGHVPGSTRLTRTGERTTTYWCLTDSLARLR